MQKRIGLKKIKIASIYLPGDMPHRVETDRVAELAESILTQGIIHPPTVRLNDRSIICGRDRIAALMKLGRKDVEVMMIECDEWEVDILAMEEDARRRHDPKEQSSKRVKLVEHYTKLEERKKKAAETPGPGRPLTPLGKARVTVAKQQGIKKDSVRRAELRAKKKAEQPAEEPEVVPSVVDDLGMEIEDGLLTRMGMIQAGVNRALNHMRQAKVELTKVSGLEGLGPLRIADHQHELDLLTAALRAERPHTLCPYCKAIPEYMGNCVPCAGAGWVGKLKLENVPKELLDIETTVVMVQGRMTTVEIEEWGV